MNFFKTTIVMVLDMYYNKFLAPHQYILLWDMKRAKELHLEIVFCRCLLNYILKRLKIFIVFLNFTKKKKHLLYAIVRLKSSNVLSFMKQYYFIKS